MSAGIDEQIGNEDHHAAAGIGFGGAGEDVVESASCRAARAARARGRSS